MHLQFAGQPVIAASRDEVWRRLLDPHFVAASTPGVEDVRVTDPTHFRVVSGIGVGPFKLRFTVDIELYDIVERTSARMRMRGHAPGSTVAVESEIRLEDIDPEQVRLHWQATSEIHGMAAGVGGRFMEAAARNLTEMFWKSFARRAAAGAA